MKVSFKNEFLFLPASLAPSQPESISSKKMPQSIIFRSQVISGTNKISVTHTPLINKYQRYQPNTNLKNNFKRPPKKKKRLIIKLLAW